MFGLIVGTAVVIFVVPLGYFLLAQRTFMHEHHRHYRDFMSEDERLALFAGNPVGLLRVLPGDTGRRLNAMLTPDPDPRLESLRRRAGISYLVVMVNAFACIPLALLLIGFIQRVGDGRVSIATVVVGAGLLVLAAVGTRYLVRNRHAPSGARFRVGLLAIGVAVILAAVSIGLGYVQP